jgi:hypothetical protein
MERITIKHLQRLADHFNEITGSPRTYFQTAPQEFGKNKTTIGHYHIDSAYGGFALDRTCSDGGGVVCVLMRGSARDLQERMYAWLGGYRAAKDDLLVREAA